MIIGICGYKGSGKDSMGQILTTSFGWDRMSFAEPIKELVHNTFGIDKAILSGNEGEREFRELPLPDWFNYSPRQLLQIIGTGFRDSLHPDIWVKILENKVKRHNNHVVVTDVRFPNEVEMINNNGFCVVVKRPGYNGDDHISEHALDDHKFKYVFNNDSSEETLQAKFYNFLKDRIV